MPAPDLSRIQGLARPSEQERTEYAAFLAALRTLLRDPWIRHAGRSLPLADYLDAVRPAPVSGDEQDVVDRLSLRLLASLGYSEADLAYNRRLPVDTRAVPDITVRLSEIPASLPVFVVEDKATDIRDFLRPRPGADGQRETPYEQLRRYVQGGGVQGRQGLLCNGFVLEAWEFGPGGGMRLVSLDLAALGRDALDGPWPGAQDKALRVVFDRFSKFAFLQTWDLAGRHFIKPKPSAEWLARMQAALAEGPDAFRDVVALFHLDNWKARAADAFAHADTLVDALKDLIALFEDDVHQQVLDALARATGYSAARRELVQGSRVGALRERVWALRGAFPEDEFQGLLMDPLDEWCAEPRIEDLQRLAQEWIAPLDPLFRTAVGKAGHQPDAFDGKDVIEDVGRTAAARKRFRLDALAAAIRDLCKAALDEHVERQRLDAAGGTAQQARIAFEAWKSRVDKTVFVGAEPDELVREYARQTAYVYIVRLLLVRICEDKGLFQRKLSDGGLLEWQDQARRYLDFASGRSYEYLTQMAYECAQNVYAHFFGASQPFDWYRMDEKVLVRALLVLDAFNLAQIDEDIIGTVYGRFLTEGKHEQGRYYTSTDLVHLMLDRAGWTPGATVGRRLADISCGSGSFLVEGARRILASFRGPDGRIPDSSVERALYEVQRGVVGLDLNPFACYLAETNLLIQVLDLVHQAWDCGIRVSVDRFHVYCTDSLIVDEVAGAVADGSAAILLGRDEVEAELIKSRTGPYRDGFDVIVGNPPYVRADEAAPRWVDYRHRVEAQAWFTTAHQKWDLYVPFVEQNRRLLSDAPGARCCLVTIESIKTSPYVAKLHELLGRQSTVYDIVFTERLKLFPDAKWQDNVVFTFGRGQPTPDTVTTREICRQRGPGGTLRLVPMDEVRQAETEPDRLFNPTTAVELDRSDTVAWEEICYVSKGMVLHSSERLADGEVVAVPAAYDPSNFGEELVRIWERRASGYDIDRSPGIRCLEPGSTRSTRDQPSSRRTFCGAGSDQSIGWNTAHTHAVRLESVGRLSHTCSRLRKSCSGSSRVSPWMTALRTDSSWRPTESGSLCAGATWPGSTTGNSGMPGTRWPGRGAGILRSRSRCPSGTCAPWRFPHPSRSGCTRIAVR